MIFNIKAWSYNQNLYKKLLYYMIRDIKFITIFHNYKQSIGNQLIKFCSKRKLIYGALCNHYNKKSV